MTTLSRISMAAVAALIVGMGPASAADLGGNCCADLEERVAELEATTARKGNRKVSVTISGQISQQLLFWDDGVSKDVYISGPTSSNSRWRITGSAKISPEITAGFMYEFEAFGSSSASQNQMNGTGPSNTVGTPNNFGDDGGATSANLRQHWAYVEHSRLGRVEMGFGATEANNIILIDLSGKGMAASNDVRLHNSSMRIAQGNGQYSGATWGTYFQGGSGDWLNERSDHISYRTPTIAGFTLGASFAEDNYWDVAMRYAGEFNGIRIAAGLGYSVRSEYNNPTGEASMPTTGAGAGTIVCTVNCDKELRQLVGALSVRHMPTGLFFTGAFGDRDYENTQTTVGGVAGTARDFSASFFYLSGGVARNFFGIGDTVMYGEYSEWKGASQDTGITTVSGPTGAGNVSAAGLSGDKLTHWGVGIVQNVDAAAMEFWLAYKNYSLDSAQFNATVGGAEDLHMFTAGTRIRF
ncbi:porin [Hyphomicrobium sp. CS1BSMeth3]|uniref:porin n=1 Tax=Hyphomicrobium sp. CS1BSMeth3 TaxID=1892844 RepID=UPI000931D8F2|nr:porin [Hyphomicrobium sp. CS1BSMeth3]